MEADTVRFHDSVRKVAALTHDLKHISILLDVLVAEVCLLYCHLQEHEDSVAVLTIMQLLNIVCKLSQFYYTLKCYFHISGDFVVSVKL